MNNPKKFAVVGSSCAGKSTVAKTIAKKLDIDYIGIDYINWLPNWVERPDEETRKILNERTSKDTWIVDGNYSRFQDITFPRTNIIIWLNFSFIRVLYRALKRTISRAISQEELFPGCRESFYMSFCSKESILLWVLTTWKKKRDKYRKMFDEKLFGDKIYIECRNPKELDRYVDTLR